MREKLLKRKLNPFLLVTTVLVLAFLAGASVMYQHELSKLVGNNQNLSAELETAETQLEEARQNLSALESRNQNLSTDLEETESELSTIRKQKNSLNQTVEDLQDENSELENQLESRSEEISNYTTRIEDLEDENSDLRLNLGEVCMNEAESGNLTEESETICGLYGYP